ncbi:GtrA family protein [Leptolyngbya cf. ectocarpi LEGE 11479]|uniref:GtrA family protein n=1 Tax=Leptolyngbya cf. ectocarpi LEGE 11479 TaxID=1828722 RepID=A0A928ZYU8_LEPEC|nr:GtrA family protein [Leptolyngbya ectocarpi]MBE9069955.1 GtrA family protein [Leptolyngbya cf. ectocarpi LEGE 11479]
MGQNFRISNFIDRLATDELLAFFRHLTRFSIVGLSGVFLDLGGFYCLHQMLGWTITPSAMASTELAIINNFLGNENWTFRDISMLRPRFRDRMQRFIKFNLICLVGLVLNILIVDLMFYTFGVNEYVAKIIAIAGVVFWNFNVNLKLNWQVKEQASEPTGEENTQKEGITSDVSELIS